MGHTNSTANLSLPQFIGTDKPTWLGDVNGAFSAIDSYAGTNDAAVAAAASDASSAISQAAAAVNTANTANTTAGNASTAATAAVTAANQANALSNQIALRTGVLSDLTTTDKTSIVNAINEVNGKDAGDIAYDNTGSGLTATNVQAAIDEVAQGGGGGGTGLTLVWSNADPSQSFAAQSVTVSDATQYKAFLVILAEANSVLVNEISGICISGNAAYIEHIWSNFHQLRTATINQSGSTITIAFSDTMRYNNDGTGSGAAANTSLVPKFVYGIA